MKPSDGFWKYFHENYKIKNTVTAMVVSLLVMDSCEHGFELQFSIKSEELPD
jgi:hypothetical protein